MIQVRKVIEHVYEKVLRQGVENGHQSNDSGDHEKETYDVSKLAAEKVELLCNDQVGRNTEQFPDEFRHMRIRYLISQVFPQE